MTLFGTLRVKVNTTKLIIPCDAILKNTGKVKSHWKNMFPMIYLSSLEGEFWSHGKLNLSWDQSMGKKYFYMTINFPLDLNMFRRSSKKNTEENIQYMYM
jgi:hypothetical protein